MVQISFATSTILFLLSSSIVALPLADVYERDVASLDERDDLLDLYERDLSYNWLNERDDFELESRMFRAALNAAKGVAKEVG
jgi:hypothetical protein